MGETRRWVRESTEWEWNSGRPMRNPAPHVGALPTTLSALTGRYFSTVYTQTQQFLFPNMRPKSLWQVKYHVTITDAITDASQILLLVKAADRLRKDMI